MVMMSLTDYLTLNQKSSVCSGYLKYVYRESAGMILNLFFLGCMTVLGGEQNLASDED